MEIINISKRHIVFKAALEGWDLNIHLIKAEHREYLIDTGIGVESIKWILPYRDESKPLVVVNSHHHWDHIYGNGLFKDEVIVSHELCAPLIASHWYDTLQQAKQYTDERASMLLPNVTFSDRMSFLDDDIHLFHTPGHSVDGISIYDGVEEVLNMGDNLGDTVEDIVPYLDTSPKVYRESLERCLTYDIKVCISGHCGIQSPDVIRTVLEKIEKE